uniref:Secreted protein n=1 Tax=Rhipicephalus appendiculatus TaxID=34631 RepID=A0A131YEP2_RHIAP
MPWLVKFYWLINLTLLNREVHSWDLPRLCYLQVVLISSSLHLFASCQIIDESLHICLSNAAIGATCLEPIEHCAFTCAGSL